MMVTRPLVEVGAMSTPDSRACRSEAACRRDVHTGNELVARLEPPRLSRSDA